MLSCPRMMIDFFISSYFMSIIALYIFKLDYFVHTNL